MLCVESVDWLVVYYGVEVRGKVRGSAGVVRDGGEDFWCLVVDWFAARC